MPTAANMVRDVSSLKHPVRDRFWCLLQPTWSETSQIPGPRRLLGLTAANMVRDLSSTRSETEFIVPTAANMVRDLSSTRYPVRDRF